VGRASKRIEEEKPAVSGIIFGRSGSGFDQLRVIFEASGTDFWQLGNGF
jgi:hypothetical protein